MIRYCMVLAVALASCLAISSDALGESTTLQLSILRPTPPITTADVIWLKAATAENVFQAMVAIDYSSSFVVDGFDINWSIATRRVAGAAAAVDKPMWEIRYDVGPLPAGTYEVTANWTHTGDGLLTGAPSSGIGFMSFSVVPEPSTCAMLMPLVILPMLSTRLRWAPGVDE